jgi:ElaB/YqjD/DUF883 family membrane-anchored ribosome-binding protein
MQTTIGTDMAKDELRDASTSRKKGRERSEAPTPATEERLDLSELLETARSFLKDAGAKAVESAKERPAVTLAVAVGVGFILGGGLSTRIGRMALLGAVELALKQFTRAGGLVG